MKRPLSYLLAAMLPALAAGEGFSAVKTGAGVVVVHDAPEFRFTVEIPGKTIEPLEHPRHFFLKVDGVPFQIQTTSVADIYGKPVEVSSKGLMLAHRDWEEANLEKTLSAKLLLEAALVTLADGTDGLFWSYAMPEGMDAEVTKQIYLTRAVDDRVVGLNAALLKGAKEETIRKSLLSAANSFKMHGAPLDLGGRKASVKAAPPTVPNEADKPQKFVFILNKKQGGVRVVGDENVSRIEFFDDAGNGIETMWETGLRTMPDGTWVTDRGISVGVEKLAEPVVLDDRSFGWKLKISGKDPAYRELKKVMPLVDYGDAENTEFFGNPESADGQAAVANDQAVRTPPAGSSERQAIMDVLRFDFYRDKQKARQNPNKILFVVHHLKVKDDWACVNATPTQNGREAAEPRWIVMRRHGEMWEDVDYFEKLRPFASEEEAMDALDMSNGTVKRLLPKLPGCPKEIFP